VRRLTLSSDYDAEWPLWSEREGMVDPAAHGVPADVCADLRAWQGLFDAHFDPDSGWRSGSAEQQYARVAVDLLRRLQSELGADVALSLDAWPLSNASLVRWVEHRVAHDRTGRPGAARVVPDEPTGPG
jgi:hypothetical protein